MVGSSPICHISTGNLPGLPEHGATITSFVNLTDISDAAAKERDTKLKDMDDMWLRSEDALPTLSTENQHLRQHMEDARCALSKEKEQKQVALLQQRVTFKKQMNTEKQHMKRELAAH